MILRAWISSFFTTNLPRKDNMYTPYEYQKECLVVLKATRAQAINTALIVMASGLGKTVTVAFDVNEWLKTNRGRILYLCHQNEILSQAQRRFEDVLGDKCSYGFFTGLEKTAHQADCLFASFQTISRNTERIFAEDEFGYIFVDESHHSQAVSHLKTVQYFKPKFLLGATATPDRADRLNIRSVFGEEVYNLPLEKALAQGLLTRVDYRLVTDEISIGEISEADIEELTIKDLNKALFSSRHDKEIADSIERHSSELREQRIVVFASTIAHAEQLARNIAGSTTIHSEVPTKERIVRLELFRQGMITTAITVDCFNEGIDIPEANMLVFLRSTASQRIFYQQLGRGLRLCQGKDKVIVLDFVGNAERLTMLKELADAIGMQTKAFKIKFDEKACRIIDLVERMRPLSVADMPDLLAEYSPKNPLPASRASVRSHKEVWWICGKCGNEWQTSSAGRLRGRECLVCGGQVTKRNNLSVLHPDLAEEYSEKNPIKPDQVIATSCEFVMWKCRKCSYEYAARPYSRVFRKDRCPACIALIDTFADNMAFRLPHLVREYARINTTSPERLGTNKTVLSRWWTCPHCKSDYTSTVGDRMKGVACPYCPEKIEKVVPQQAEVLMTDHLSLAEEYSSRNKEPVETVLADTSEQLWWVCSDCGRYWQSSGRERLNGKRCPYHSQFTTASCEVSIR